MNDGELEIRRQIADTLISAKQKGFETPPWYIYIPHPDDLQNIAVFAINPIVMICFNRLKLDPTVDYRRVTAHELGHYVQYREIGREGFVRQSDADREKYVEDFVKEFFNANSR